MDGGPSPSWGGSLESTVLPGNGFGFRCRPAGGDGAWQETSGLKLLPRGNVRADVIRAPPLVDQQLPESLPVVVAPTGRIC